MYRLAKTVAGKLSATGGTGRDGSKERIEEDTTR